MPEIIVPSFRAFARRTVLARGGQLALSATAVALLAGNDALAA
jgi:hypothetical protein